ncbi:MAG: hypothetical protein M3R51_06370 [Candidatus Eremiobacteraeota bacterium]|nr:hypothetical protein [Candidatus Eremiobacteraeota bacterium]
MRSTTSYDRLPITAHLEEQKSNRLFTTTLLGVVFFVALGAMVVIAIEENQGHAVDATREIASIVLAGLFGALGGSALKR